ncbi:MAG: hypothetical protein GXN99_01460, partial [Candidatus Nanohaloarchaeota archaeon]|nr:hypothetical protein [Candidatus Nanohaloarchaeota archaeon]
MKFYINNRTSHTQYFIYKDNFCKECLYIEILTTQPVLNYTIELINLTYYEYPLFSEDLWNPLTKEMSIEAGCVYKIYFNANNTSTFTKVVLRADTPVNYKFTLKSPSLSASIHHHLKEIIIAILIFFVGVLLTPHLMVYLYSLKEWIKIKKEIENTKAQIRNIEQDYFHRRINQEMFN